MGAREAKVSLQDAIDSGQIVSIGQLLERATAEKLEVTRNGRDYLGLRGSDGRRFRVHFGFANDSRTHRPTSTPPQPEPKAVCNVRRSEGYWIYALTAHSPDGKRKACYIGQTVNLKRRFREHLRRNRPGHASFFESAASLACPGSIGGFDPSAGTCGAWPDAGRIVRCQSCAVLTASKKGNHARILDRRLNTGTRRTGCTAPPQEISSRGVGNRRWWHSLAAKAGRGRQGHQAAR